MNVKKQMKNFDEKMVVKRNKFSQIISLKELDDDNFRNYLKIKYNCFSKILNLVSPLIFKQNTHRREAVSAKEKLVSTLKFEIK